MSQPQEKSSQPGLHILQGDSIYFHHPDHGAVHGKVVAVGKDGCLVERDGSHHKVRWDKVLGHRERKVRRLQLIDRGEDGGIGLDEDGKRVFIHGAIPDDEEGSPDEDLQKSCMLPHNPLLIDIGHLHGEACDHALEGLFKAISNEDGLAFDIWMAHENPFIRDLVEKFSDRGLTKIAKVQDELSKWMVGIYHVPSKETVPIPSGFLGHWSQEETELVRIYLSNIPPEEMELSDWSLAIDYVVQKHLPADALYEEGEWLATKANLLGRAQAHLSTIDASVAAGLIPKLPSTVSAAVKAFSFSQAERAILEYGKEACCDAVVALSEVARHRLKRVVLDFEQRKLAGEEVSHEALQTSLFDQFSSLNRDWRRIAVTEAGEIANQGVISHLAVGSNVRRIEMYNGACAFCRKIDGRVYRVTSASDPDKDGEHDVWPGKTNIGRSASPTKRVGGALVPRETHELFWAAAGVQHPHCRGRWEPMSEPRPGDDPKFAKWLQKRLAETR